MYHTLTLLAKSGSTLRQGIQTTYLSVFIIINYIQALIYLIGMTGLNCINLHYIVFFSTLHFNVYDLT